MILTNGKMIHLFHISSLLKHFPDIFWVCSKQRKALLLSHVSSNARSIVFIIWFSMLIGLEKSFLFSLIALFWAFKMISPHVVIISSVQFSHSVMSDSLRPHELQHARPPCPSPTISSSVIPSVIRVFSSESVFHIRWPKYWRFSFSISPSNSVLVSFRIDWFDLLAVQGTLKSLLQHHSSKASILRSAFFMIHLSHPYVITGKTISFD